MTRQGNRTTRLAWAAALLLAACGGGSSRGEDDVTADSGDTGEHGADTDSEPTPDPLGPGVCGDGRRDDGEDCDLGVGNEVGRDCTEACERPTCGDGIVSPGEACDDGNLEPGDGCAADCTAEGAPRWSAILDGDPHEEYAAALAVTAAGYVMAGARAYAWDDVVPTIIAFDHDGAPRWQEEIESGRGYGEATGALAVGDDVVVVGRRPLEHFDTEAWAARRGPDGEARWTVALDIPFAETATAIAPHSEGRAWVAGNLRFDPETGLGPAWVAEVDLSDGAVMARYDLTAPGLPSSVADLASDGAGGFVAAGTRQDFDARGEPALGSFVARYAAPGRQTWEHFEFGDTFSWRSLALGPAGEVYVTGVSYGDEIASPISDNDIAVAAFDAEGTLQWTDLEEGPETGFDIGEDVVVAPDGTILVAGALVTQPLQASQWWDYDAWLRHYEPDGTILSTRTYDGPMHGRDRLGALTLVPGEDGNTTIVTAGDTVRPYEDQNPWLAAWPLDAPVAGQAPSLPPVEIAACGPGSPASASPSRAAADALAGAAAPWPPATATAPHAATLFVDFGGATLRPGSDASAGETPCIDGAVPWPAWFGSHEDAARIIKRVRKMLAPYRVHVRWQSPPPDYLPATRVMVGGTAESIGLPVGPIGYACDVDCGNATQRDLAFAFDSGSIHSIASAIVHEAAHTWGLDHVEATGALMNPFVGADATILDECLAASDATSPIACGEAHAAFCPAGEQNTHAELLAVFGPRTDDLSPPRAEILSPPDRSLLPLGRAILVEVAWSDDDGNAGARLGVEGLDWGMTLSPDETEVEIYLPPGDHVLTLDVADHSGRTTRDLARIRVAEP